MSGFFNLNKFVWNLKNGTASVKSIPDAKQVDHRQVGNRKIRVIKAKGKYWLQDGDSDIAQCVEKDKK